MMDAVHGASARILPCVGVGAYCYLLSHAPTRILAGPLICLASCTVERHFPTSPGPGPCSFARWTRAARNWPRVRTPPTTRRTCLSGIVGSQLGKCLWPQAPPPSPQHTSPRLTPAFILFSSGFFRLFSFSSFFLTTLSHTQSLF